MTTLTFRSWRRSGAYELATTPTGGRLRGTIEVTVEDRDDATDTATAMVPFQVMGPSDVRGLTPAAIRAMQPPPLSRAVEVAKAAHVELASLDLPWRHTPEVAAGDRLRPWIVLVVAAEEELTVNADGTVTVGAAALADHPLADSARWAHIDDSDAHRTARLLSPRLLEADRDYVAVVVPAFDDTGADRWPAAPAGAVTVPAYHVWRFSTGAAGDFVSLAARIRPDAGGPALGRAPVDYDRVVPPSALSVRGALAPIGGTDAPLPAAVAADVAELRTPLTDPRGRPVVSLPDYAAAWTADPAVAWAQALNGDPRHRGVAGLGADTAVGLQNTLVDAVVAQAGALDLAAARVRHLTFGLHADRLLWQRRLPADPIHRLWILGPGLRRLTTASGPVTARLRSGHRPVPPELLSSAARRVLRPGPARTRFTAPGACDPRRVFEAANRCPPPPARALDGLAHADRVAPSGENLDQLLAEVAKSRRLPIEPILDLMRKADVGRCGRALAERLTRLFDQIERDARARGCLPRVWLTHLLALLAQEKCPAAEIGAHLELFDPECDDPSVVDLAGDVVTEPPERPCQPLDLDRFAGAVAAAYDPTVARPFVVDRVLNGITGLDPVQPLAPPQLCPDLGVALWRHLHAAAPDWLLPGGGQLATDTVAAVETNPTFVDAFLAGANSQLLEELRWRNIPITRGCTPVRTFWDRFDLGAGTRVRDITGIGTWAASSALGSAAHQTPSAASTDLVLVFRSPLFERYPQTLVYLFPAATAGDGRPDWDADPDFAAGAPTFPTFQGAIGEGTLYLGFDVSPAEARDHWVVLEEPPPGYRFRNRPAESWDAARRDAFVNATTGSEFAAAAFSDPTRVLIRGDRLIPPV